jgi:hypothetical protein
MGVGTAMIIKSASEIEEESDVYDKLAAFCKSVVVNSPVGSLTF